MRAQFIPGNGSFGKGAEGERCVKGTQRALPAQLLPPEERKVCQPVASQPEGKGREEGKEGNREEAKEELI